MKNKWKNVRLHTKLLISYLLACIIPLVTVSAIIYDYAANSIEESALEFASIFTSQIVSNIDEFMEQYDRVTKSVLVDNDILAGMDSEDVSINEQADQQLYLRKIMMRIMTLKPEIQEIMLLMDQNKLYQFSSSGEYVNPESLLVQPWLDEMLVSKDTLTITSIHNRTYYEYNQDGMVLTLGRQIMDYGGSYFGLLLIDMKPDSLIELNDDFLLARNKYNIKISITDQNGGILYDSDVASGIVSWEEAIASTLLLDKNPDEYIVMSSQTKRGNLNVNTVIPRSTLLMKVDRINYVSIVAMALCLIIIFIVSLILSLNITKPIKRLQKNMKLVENGEYQVLEIDGGGEIGSLVVSYNHMVIQIKTLIEEVYMAEIKQRNAKFLALQTQINPHMLYNTLESIRMKALIRGEDELAEMIKILSKMFRASLDNRTSGYKIKDEIEYAENYVKIQNIRYEDQFILTLDFEDEIMNESIIQLILQPIVENCIEHGYRGPGKPLGITVMGRYMAGGDVILMVADNGKGLTEDKITELNHLLSQTNSEILRPETTDNTKHTSIGLSNIAERIRLYYGEDYYLHIYAAEKDGITVELKIPGRNKHVSNIGS